MEKSKLELIDLKNFLMINDLLIDGNNLYLKGYEIFDILEGKKYFFVRERRRFYDFFRVQAIFEEI